MATLKLYYTRNRHHAVSVLIITATFMLTSFNIFYYLQTWYNINYKPTRMTLSTAPLIKVKVKPFKY